MAINGYRYGEQTGGFSNFYAACYQLTINN